MIYENFKYVQEIMYKIWNNEAKLLKLQDGDLKVLVYVNDKADPLYTIGVDKRFEHPHQPDAELLAEKIKYRIKSEISELKKQLELL